MPEATAVDPFDAFRQAARDPNLTPRSPLIDALNAAHAKTKARVDAADAVLKALEEKITRPYGGEPGRHRLEEWRDEQIAAFARNVAELLREGHELPLKAEFVYEALAGQESEDAHGGQFGRARSSFQNWDPAKLVAARRREFGDLEETEKATLFQTIQERLIPEREEAPKKPEHLLLRLYLFNEREKGVIRVSYNAGPYLAAFTDAQRLAEHLARKKPLAQCTAFVPPVLTNPHHQKSRDVYNRWVDLHGAIRRVRFNTDARVTLEFENAGLKARFIEAMMHYAPLAAA